MTESTTSTQVEDTGVRNEGNCISNNGTSSQSCGCCHSEMDNNNNKNDTITPSNPNDPNKSDDIPDHTCTSFSSTNVTTLDTNNNTAVKKMKPKRIIIRRRPPHPSNKNDTTNTSGGGSSSCTQTNHHHTRLDETLLDEIIRTTTLPNAYEFELSKTLKRCYELRTVHIALQLPEGLLMYATLLGDIFIRCCTYLQQVTILGDVTYGACCIDDINATLLGAQLLVHYGHSCLVPQNTIMATPGSEPIPVLYVFVEIQINIQHFVNCLHETSRTYHHHHHDRKQDNKNSSLPIYLLGTVQFRHALSTVQRILRDEYHYQHVIIPQVKPLSPGEVLGCTSPILPNYNSKSSGDTTTSTSPTTSNGIVCFVADGRFHLESTMISNPHMEQFYRYDPYSCVMTIEKYDHKQMKGIRWKAIDCVMQQLALLKKENVVQQQQQPSSCFTFGIILGTLGRQGNPAIVQQIQNVLKKQQQELLLHNKRCTIRYFTMLLSEITPYKLQLFQNKVNVWVQVACPRLSVDWGHLLTSSSTKTIPVLSPYELFCVFDGQNNNNKYWSHDDDTYPMDYYSNHGGPWTNYHESNRNRQLLTKPSH